MIVSEIAGAQVVEQIQEQIAESIKVFHRRTKCARAMPVPQTQESIV